MTSSGDNRTEGLRRSLELITVAGCLAMIYLAAISSPATTEFFRMLGAHELHFGLLAGIPLSMIFLQFWGALLANRLARRKPAFVIFAILSRLIYLPAAALPFIFPQVAGPRLVPWLILLFSLSAALGQISVPLWFSWMSDLIPRRRVNSYWGQRHVWMQGTWLVTFLAIFAYTYFGSHSATVTFAVLVAVGVTCGIIDILLFLKVKEPENTVLPEVKFFELLSEPLRNPQFRRFVVFNCCWMAAVMFAASFLQVYVLKVFELGAWKTTLIWCMSGSGAVVAAKFIGRLADRLGNRPILVMAISLKSLTTLVFLLVTRESVVYVLPVFFFFDSILNAAYFLGVNGYMLKFAPRENRSMFIAAITGLAGICGGLSALAGGAFLRFNAEFSLELFGRDWDNYKLLFAVGTVLRLCCLPLARRITEPNSASSTAVLGEVLAIWPQKLRLFPVGLYRKWHPENEKDSD